MGRLAVDPQAGIWIGPRTRNAALLHFHDGALKEFPTGAAGDQHTNHLLARADGSVMAAFDDGLVGLRQGKAQRMTTKNGLPCDAVYSFIEDTRKTWWLNTECGLVELADSELQRWWENPDAVVRIRLNDALDGARPGRYGITSADVSRDGRVWFATGFVVQMVNPSRLSQAALPAQTHVDSVIVDRRELKAVDELEIGPNPRDLQIGYTSPTFAIPQKVRFRYRLDGHDHDWHDAGTRRQAFYTDLPPGQYSFHVIASNQDGVWNERATTLNFSIAPAYYQTSWFRAMVAVLLLLAAGAAYRLRVRGLHRQFEMMLDARVAERTRVARELHDTLLQSFHGLLLRFQTAFNLLPDRPAESKQILAGAIEQAAEAITEGRDAVQGLRTSATERNDLADSIRTLGEMLANESSSEAVLRIEVLGTPRALHPIVRDEVFRIAGEALRNAFRHSTARQIEVELRYDDRQLRLRVRDDGKGIDPEVLRADGREGHYGLRGMRERAKLAGGRLAVWSGLDAGTEVELSIPAPHAYGSSSPSGSWKPWKPFRQGAAGDP
jgi:signal transduction histidine kinase